MLESVHHESVLTTYINLLFYGHWLYVTLINATKHLVLNLVILVCLCVVSNRILQFLTARAWWVAFEVQHAETSNESHGNSCSVLLLLLFSHSSLANSSRVSWLHHVLQVCLHEIIINHLSLLAVIKRRNEKRKYSTSINSVALQ